MKHRLKSKFKDEKLKQFLLNTKDAILIEGSPYEKFWGVGLAMSNPRINWLGNAQNKMGQLLNELRTQLKHEETD